MKFLIILFIFMSCSHEDSYHRIEASLTYLSSNQVSGYDSNLKQKQFVKDFIISSFSKRNVIISKDSTSNNLNVLKAGKNQDSYIILRANYNENNISGVSSLIEVARMLNEYETENTIMFLFSSNNEINIEKEKIKAIVELDKIGSLNRDKRELTVYGVSSHPSFTKILSTVEKHFKFKLVNVKKSKRHHIPTLKFTTMNTTVSTDIKGIKAISKFIARLVPHIDKM